MLLQARLRPLLQLLQRPPRLCHPDHRHLQPPVPATSTPGRKYLLVRQIPRRPKKHQSIRFLNHFSLRLFQNLCVHSCPFVANLRRHIPATCFSTCPPNSNRIADSTLSAKSSCPRELNRSNSAADSTAAGTASSIAAATVHRPSPESDTRPGKRPQLRLLLQRRPSDPAANSRSPPRCHNSAISARSNSYW